MSRPALAALLLLSGSLWLAAFMAPIAPHRTPGHAERSTQTVWPGP